MNTNTDNLPAAQSQKRPLTQHPFIANMCVCFAVHPETKVDLTILQVKSQERCYSAPFHKIE